MKQFMILEVFPELYEIKYRAKGSSHIASILETKFKNKGISVHHNMTRGLDHGSWTLLHRMYPEANIPVVQISVNPFLSAKEQFEIGEALKGLGQEDILVIGSGVTVHNLRALKWNQTTPENGQLNLMIGLLNICRITIKMHCLIGRKMLLMHN